MYSSNVCNNLIECWEVTYDKLPSHTECGDCSYVPAVGTITLITSRVLSHLGRCRVLVS